MRVVGGVLRGRALLAPKDRHIRPTADRVREAVFNRIAHAAWGLDLDGAAVADLCCGSGALGIEALSRGAARAVFLDSNRTSLALCRDNLAALGLEPRARLLRGNIAHPPPAPFVAELLLIDPPYGEAADLIGAALPALLTAGWLAEGALVIIEQDARTDLSPPTGFAALAENRYGDTAVRYWRSDKTR